MLKSPFAVLLCLLVLVGCSPGPGRLVAVGDTAQTFEFSTPDGGKLDLDQVIKSHKATVIDFWFYD